MKGRDGPTEWAKITQISSLNKWDKKLRNKYNFCIDILHMFTWVLSEFDLERWSKKPNLN